MSPEEVALSNTIIRKEIFKQSCFYVQQKLRLVSREWMIETLPYWRKTTWISIKIDSSVRRASKLEDGKYFDWHTPQEFMEMARLEPSADEDPLAGINKVSLEKYPFRRFKIFGNVLLSKSEGERYENQVAFWSLCGPHATHVKLEELYRSNDIWMLHRLLVNTCPNLEILEIFNADRRMKKPCKDGNYTGLWNSDLILQAFLRKSEKVKAEDFRKVASKLHSLKIFGHPLLNEKDSKELIQRCPKLKVLHTTNAMLLDAIVLPAANGDFIKLEELVLKCQSSLHGLTQYIGKFPDAIKVLELNCLPLDLDDETAEGYPHSVYAAIAQCTQLQDLKLTNKCESFSRKLRNELKKETPFFLGFSSHPFPNLTRLQLGFKYMKFDFSCLKRMPVLEELRISCDYMRQINARERKIFTETQEDIENEVFTKLRKLTMDYPVLSFKDVKQLSKWFPNLTYLDIALKAGVERAFLVGFVNLRTLFLHPRGSIQQKEADLIQEKRKTQTLQVSFKSFRNYF